MRVVFRPGRADADVDDDGTELEVEITVHDADATVADLARALVGTAAGSDPSLLIDGQRVPATRRLDRAGIRHGAVIGVVDGPVPKGPANGSGRASPPTAGGPRSVSVVGGLDAGAVHPLGAGSWTAGRGEATVRLDHPTVSDPHAGVRIDPRGAVTITDQASLNGTWVDGRPALGAVAVAADAIVRLGAVQLTIGPPPADDRPALPTEGRSASPTLPFNRHPRPAPPGPAQPVVAPIPPEGSRASMPIGIVAVVAPLAMGLVMIKVFGSLMFGLFALLSPVMLIGGAVESRRRARKGSRKERQRFARELHEFTMELRRRAVAERARLAREVPDPPEVLRRATGPSTQLWERRHGHHDFLHLRAGIGPVPWGPPIDAALDPLPPAVEDAVRRQRLIVDAPVVLDLSTEPVIGLVGHRQAALAVARWLLVQAAIHHGPADLSVAIAVAPSHRPEWEWTKWLPHTIDPADPARPRLAAGPTDADRMLRALVARPAPVRSGGPARDRGIEPLTTCLLVVDDESLTAGRRSPARSVLRGHAGPAAGIVIAATEDRLPATCTTVIELLDRHGTARCHRLETGERVEPVLATGVSEATARTTARALARFEDPEAATAAGSLPPRVGLLPLLALEQGPGNGTDSLAGGLARRWAEAGPDPALVTPIGMAEDGVLAIDLVTDGPHALVAGTTGAGKSELLRTLVAGLASACSPDHVTFVLIDFKGGSAFDQCARLPHTVGLVTDLDPHLAARALRCMEAELRHRERRLRAAGVADLGQLRRRPGQDPLPRLVVVIDEFATLKAELGDFVESLVGIAQRGRSLGVHLVLATQRPSGAVSESIRANTNLRIALRVQDEADSSDVIDRPDAAHIGRDQPGRALARLGPGEVIAVQTALSTGIRSIGGAAPVEVRPFRFGPSPDDRPTVAEPAAVDDLTRLVDAAQAAVAGGRHDPPRRPWPDPLPGHVDLDRLRSMAPARLVAGRGRLAATVDFALADDPDAQAQYPIGWERTAGNLLLIGLPGSGTTTACASLALAVAAGAAPDHAHLHVLDFGAGDLGPLAELPHVGSVVLAGERERQARLVRWLRAEAERRRALVDPRASEPSVIVLLDGMAGFRAEWDGALVDVADSLQRVFAEGPELGIHMVVTADRIGAVPSAMYSLARQRWLFRLADDHEYASAGLRPAEVPALGPGGAWVADRGLEARVARASTGLAEAVGRLRSAAGAAGGRTAVPIAALPNDVPLASIGRPSERRPDPTFLPIGIGDQDLQPVGLVVRPGMHVLVAGPARSGRSTALLTIAAAIRGAGRALVVAVAATPSPLRASPAVDRVLDPADRWDVEAWVGTAGRPVWILVDDADRVPDDDGAIDALLARHLAQVHVVAAGANDGLRARYVHWTRTVRQSRSVLLLDPDLDLDGDLAGITLPRRSTTARAPGRGYLVTDGQVELVQVARP